MKRDRLIAEHVTINPDVMLGKPIIRGTRVPVYLIVDLVAAGETPVTIVADYPDLTIEDVEAAVAYMQREAERTETRALRLSLQIGTVGGSWRRSNDPTI